MQAKPRIQLSLIPNVKPYLIPAPEDTITTSSGSATITRTETAGNEQIIFADYGSGIEQPHVREELRPTIGDRILTSGKHPRTGTVEAANKQGLSIRWENGQLSSLTWRDYKHYGYQRDHSLPSSPEQSPQPNSQRRHSPKGKAVGWIEERQGNTHRTQPTTSYYYCWQDSDRRGKTYVPVRQMAAIRAMVDRRCSVDDILQAISKRQNPHHTETPKL